MQSSTATQLTSAHGEEGHVEGHPTPVAAWSPEEITQDALKRTVAVSTAYKLWLAVLGLLFVAGIVGVVLKIAGGTDDPTRWGYYSATVMFMLITGGSAPMVSIATRLVRSHWRRPISRAAELWGLAGIVTFLAFIPMLLVLPSFKGGGQSLWQVSEWWGPGLLPSPLPISTGMAPGAPHVWDFVSFLALVVAGLGLAVSGAIPDFAAARDHAPDGARKGLWRALSFGFHGHPRQWAVVKALQIIFGGFYFPMLVWTVSVVGMDMLETYMPEWKDPILPAQLALISLQCGVSTAVLSFWFLRRSGWHEYFGRDQFWNPGKLQLATTLLWFYFWFSQFIPFWYGRMPHEQTILWNIMFGPVLPLFLAAFLFSFPFAFLTIVWNPVRRSVNGPALAATIILIGGAFNMLRYFVGVLSSYTPGAHEPAKLAGLVGPELADILVMAGLPAGLVFVYMGLTKLFPAVNIWELRELTTLRRVQQFLQTKVLVLAKPE